MVRKTLEKDKELTPFTYIESEHKIFGEVTLNDNRRVQLKGFIDRIDLCNGNIRIVDYKTGKDSLDFTEVEALFDKEIKERRKAIMQVLLYCKLYKEERGAAQPLQPAIYTIRKLFEQFDSFVKYNRNPLLDYAQVEDSFNQNLTACLEQIFNINDAFKQTTNEEHCQYCDFKVLCRRG